MSVLSLLNQTGTVYAKSGYNKFGRDTSTSPGTLVKCRFQNKTKTINIKEGQTIVLLGIIYLNGDATINTEDRITIGTDSYKVFSVNGAIDGHGNQKLIKVEVTKWQT